MHKHSIVVLLYYIAYVGRTARYVTRCTASFSV